MKHTKRRAIALLLALVMVLPLCACGKTDNAQCRNDKTNTLYVGYVGTSFPSSYMPWQSRDGIAPTISSILYSTLFSYDDMTGEKWRATDLVRMIRSYQPHVLMDNRLEVSGEGFGSLVSGNPSI